MLPVVIDGSPDVDRNGTPLEYNPSIAEPLSPCPPRRRINLFGEKREPIRCIGKQASLNVPPKQGTVVDIHSRPQLLDKFEDRRSVREIVSNGVHHADHFGVCTVINPSRPQPRIGRVETTPKWPLSYILYHNLYSIKATH